MSLPLRHDDRLRANARAAYETLEPLHVVAYFNPHLGESARELGIDWRALYVGGRGGPLGECHDAVVSAAFYNFNPEAIAPAWTEAVGAGLPAVMAARERAVDRVLGELVPDTPENRDLSDSLQAIVDRLDTDGRVLAAAWASLPWPEPTHLRLWHAASVLREWRGDGHLATLVQAGLGAVEAVVFHEATNPDPTVRKRGMGRPATQATRAWSDEDWAVGEQVLRSRGLLEPDSETLTTAGAALYRAIEDATDDIAAAAWIGVPEPDALFVRARAVVKPILDAGILPGTRKR